MSNEKRRIPEASDIEFMRTTETEFKEKTGFIDRSRYKIFYSPVWKAKMLVLGINPGGNCNDVASDGVRDNKGRSPHSSSASYFEKGEHDLIDCSYREQKGLLKLLIPIFGSEENVRRNVVKTNMAFARSPNVGSLAIDHAIDEATPFLRRILTRTAPELILLAGVRLDEFWKRHCDKDWFFQIHPRSVEYKQTIIESASVRLFGGHTCIAVAVAHASQWSGIYKRHNVPGKVIELMQRHGIQVNSSSLFGVG